MASGNLTIYTSNRLEILAEKMSRIVSEPLSSPVLPEIIVVQSRGMERWLSMELARHNQISANCCFPFPNAFLNDIFKKLIPDLPKISLFEPGIMTFQIMKMLPSCIEQPLFESIRTYLKDDTDGLKLFQLSERIADIFDQYLVFRPEMIFSWEEGQGDYWQAHLWRMLVSKNGRHRARLRKTLFEVIDKKTNINKWLPERISIFGISYLPLFYLHVFTAMSRRVPVNLFLMNPCREYWADIVSGREKNRIEKQYAPDEALESDLHLEVGNRLLASMGTLGRNFFIQAGDVEADVSERFEDPGCGNMLAGIQSDVLNLHDPDNLTEKADRFMESDHTVQIHSCHGPMREIEVLHDNLLAMLEEDPKLMPKDIIVMTPDIEAYAPYIQAVFDSQPDASCRIPFTIADRSVKKESRLIDAFLAILDLKDTRLSAICVLNLLEFNVVRDKFNLTADDVDMLAHWIREANIRWGIDAESRSKLGVPGFKENTWQAGIERLLLGYAMPETKSKMFVGILPYDNIEGNSGVILGRFMAFLEDLIIFIGRLKNKENINGWVTLLKNILDVFILADEVSERDMLIIKSIVDGLKEKAGITGFDETIDFKIIREYLGNNLEREGFGYGFISGGVTFCAMLPMRSIPFKTVCLIGMNSDAFPRESRFMEFDLIARNPRRGDRSRRNDDKYLFLEALVSARQQFYISYVGQSIQDNTQTPPSILVSELIDYIKKRFDIDEDRLVIRHRLQAFSPAYFTADSELFTYSRENLKACAGMLDSQRKHKDPFLFLSSPLEPVSSEKDAWKQLEIDELIFFFTNPARYILQKRLEIFLDEETLSLDERENFTLTHLENYIIGQEILNEVISGADLNDFLAFQRCKGTLPHGAVGEVCYNQMAIEVKSFIRRSEKIMSGNPLDPIDINLDAAGFRISGCIKEIYRDGLIQRLYAAKKNKYVIKTWLYHLIYNVIDEKKYPLESYLICKDSIWKFHPVAKAHDILSGLLDYYRDGLAMPLQFFPESSYEYARQILLNNISSSKALHFAIKKWQGSDFSRGESRDPYYNRCFGGMESPDIFNQTFQDVSLKVYEPIFAHFEKINV